MGDVDRDDVGGTRLSGWGLGLVVLEGRTGQDRKSTGSWDSPRQAAAVILDSFLFSCLNIVFQNESVALSSAFTWHV